MMKTIARALTVVSMLLNSNVSYAGSKAGRQYPKTGCNKKLVRDIYDNENSELMDAIHKYYTEGVTHNWSEGEFCGWLRKKYEGDTQAAFEECKTCSNPEPGNDEVDRSFPGPFRREMRRVARPTPPPQEEECPTDGCGRPEQGGGPGGPGGGGLFGGGNMGPFIGGLAVGGIAGFLLAGLMNRNQPQPNYFGQPPGMLPFPGGPMGGPPGMLPFPGMGGAPGTLPLMGQGPFGGPMMAGGGQFGQSPYALPYGQQNPWGGGYNQFGGGAGYNNYGIGYGQAGGGYRGYAPGVLPLTPQGGYGLVNTIPQTHWNLINAGR